MFYNYLTVALRNLLKNKIYSFINIFGLALGLACVFLIVQYLRLELSYDRFHEGAENIYRISWEDGNPQTRTPHPMAQAMVQDFPEVESAVSITPLWGVGLTRDIFSIRNLEKDTWYDEQNVIAVDTSFFDVFTFPLIKGDPKTVLKNPGYVLLSESTAKKYFGDEDPVGKHLAVNGEEDLVEVGGVFKDVPQASHVHFDFLVSYVREKSTEDEESLYYTWADFGHYNYIRLRPGTDAKQLEAKLLSWVRKYIPIDDAEAQAIKERNFGFRLQPVTDIHLHSHLRWELEANGYIAYVYMMTAAAILILVIACVNFINLTTAQSAERAKEIGIRKSLGAFKSQLALQFTGESLLVSVIATLVAFILIEVALPFFSAITGKSFGTNYVFFITVLGGLGLLTGLISGAFPSLYLSSAQPGLILKGRFMRNPKGGGLRQAFTMFQFFASMMLICCSVIIYNQLSFIQNRSLGFDQEQIVVLPIKNRDAITPRIDELRNELGRIPGVSGVSAASNIPGGSYNQNPVFASNDPQTRAAASESLIDYDFFSVMGIELAEGRLFLRENPADTAAFVLNEAASRQIFDGKAVGKEFTWDFDDAGLIKGTVIGVVKDFHFQSLHQPVRPLLFRLLPYYNHVILKVKTDDFDQTIGEVEKTWKKFDDQFAFEWAFLSETLTKQYALEQNMASVLGTFSFIAVAIACFGLLGIAALTFRQRIKEVSVRKVLGATLPGLMVLLIKDFTKIVLVAVVLAVPLAWWLMSGWLENFTFRTTINPVVFIGAGVTLIVVAWVTLGYLTLRVAKTNPAESLKME